MDDNKPAEPVVPVEETPAVTPENPVEASADGEGKETKDRTGEQFDKLKESNKTLKQENEAMKDVIASLTPDPVPQDQVAVPQAEQFSNLEQGDIDEVYKGMIDESGYLDGDKLLATLKAMDARTKKAEEVSSRVARQAEMEKIAREEEVRTSETEALHAAYPTLDPKNESFDPDFYDAVRNEMIGQMMSGGHDPMGAAKKWHEKLYVHNAMRKEEEDKANKAEDAKRNINASMPRSTVLRGHYESDRNETLVQDIRRGKKGALAEMLNRREQGKA